MDSRERVTSQLSVGAAEGHALPGLAMRGEPCPPKGNVREWEMGGSGRKESRSQWRCSDLDIGQSHGRRGMCSSDKSGSYPSRVTQAHSFIPDRRPVSHLPRALDRDRVPVL